jgi:hypothetical protein
MLNNWLQVYARSVEKCFTREATAIDNCPTDREVFYLETEDFLLYSKFNIYPEMEWSLLTKGTVQRGGSGRN